MNTHTCKNGKVIRALPAREAPTPKQTVLSAILAAKREAAQAAFEANEELWNHLCVLAAFFRIRETPDTCPCCQQRVMDFGQLMCTDPEYTAFLNDPRVSRLVIDHFSYAYMLDEDERDRPLYTR